MMPRIALERQVLARLMAELDPAVLRRRLWCLKVLGVGAEHFTGSHARAFQALGRLAEREEWISPERVVAEAPWGVDGDYLRWLVVAYADGGSLAALADKLFDAPRRGLVDSIARVLINAASDPAADLDRAIATAVGALRRLGRAA